MFATEANLHHLRDADTWYIDGIYVPALFDQVYAIHAHVHSVTVPMVYALRTASPQSSYLPTPV